MKKTALVSLLAVCATLAGCVVAPVERPWYHGPYVVAVPAVATAHPVIWVR